jgi:hypothetical protein
MSEEVSGRLPGDGSLEAKVRPGVYRMPDGGIAEVVDDTVVALDDGSTARAYREIVYTHAGNDRRPACRITFKVQDGAPACTNFELSSASPNAVRVKDLRAFKLDELCEDVYSYVGVLVPDSTREGEWMLWVGPGTYRAAREHVDQAVARRRSWKRTDEHTKKVAAVHANAPEGQRTAAVREEFGVSQRQALRYVEDAKAAGLIR